MRPPLTSGVPDLRRKLRQGLVQPFLQGLEARSCLLPTTGEAAIPGSSSYLPAVDARELSYAGLGLG